MNKTDIYEYKYRKYKNKLLKLRNSNSMSGGAKKYDIKVVMLHLL